MTLYCASCSKGFEPRGGRGKQSSFCPDCKATRRRRAAAVRQLRYANTTVNEWIEALGPKIIGWKEDITAKQNGRCLTCGRKARLYFALDDAEQLIGLCDDDHGTWTEERRTTSGGLRS